MDGKDKSLLRLMDGSDNRFIIPVYQRNYDWGQSQCKQLYDDLIDIALNNRASHFFGCVVRAQATFSQLIESGKVSYEELSKLQDKQYSKNTLDINFPCLVLEQDLKEEWQGRYYKTPIVYQGFSYRLCSQWYEDSRSYLEKWIDSLS